MRLIDADALRKNAQHAKDISKWDGELLVVGLGHILSAPTIESPRHVWTPCSEGLPEADDVYGVKTKRIYWCAIACDISGKTRVDHAALQYLRYEGREPFWCYHGSRSTLDADDTVLAWQPLPEPYNPNKAQEA